MYITATNEHVEFHGLFWDLYIYMYMYMFSNLKVDDQAMR